MRWTKRTAACLMAMAVAGCSGRDRARDTGTTGAGGTETGATGDTAAASAQPDMSRDTTGMGGMGGMTDTGTSAGGDVRGDSARSGNRMRSDSGAAGTAGATGTSGASGAAPSANEPNQTESGMTDSSGQSTLGKGVEKTRPDQSQPVTSKGDTINAGMDSAR